MRFQGLAGGRRHEAIDPKAAPPEYWRRRTLPACSTPASTGKTRRVGPPVREGLGWDERPVGESQRSRPAACGWTHDVYHSDCGPSCERPMLRHVPAMSLLRRGGLRDSGICSGWRHAEDGRRHGASGYERDFVPTMRERCCVARCPRGPATCVGYPRSQRASTMAARRTPARTMKEERDG